jgi:hypothetical protein
MQTGTFGIGVVGVFERTLPPRSKTNYDPGYELALEVSRWFHYRHGIDLNVPGWKIENTDHLQRTMIGGYKLVFKTKLRYWEGLIELQAQEFINEFKGIYKDVLAEMEFTQGS